MAILSVTTEFIGENGVSPRIVRIATDYNYARITSAGFLSGLISQGYQFFPTDLVAISYINGSNVPVSQMFNISFNAGVPTITPAESTVILPVVNGNFANWSGTAGALADAGFSPTNAAKTKVVMAAAAVTVGHVASFADTSGTIQDGGVLGTAAAKAASDNTKATVASVSAATVSGNVLQAADIAGTVSDAGIAANKVLTTGITSPDVSPDLVSFDITVGFAALATGGSVTLVPSTGSKRYKIRTLQLNSGGTNFSGGGGDRLGQVTDGTTVYSVVPAATMQSLVNAQWGVTALPNPAAAAINTSTAAGANLTFKYSGGTTDYTAGSLVITGIAERVA